MGLTDNLISYYKCDEASGEALSDSHGSIDISINGGTPGSEAGKINTSRSFPGATAGAWFRTSHTDFRTNHSPVGSQRSWAANFWAYPFTLSTNRGVMTTSTTSGTHGMLVRSEDFGGGRFAFYNSDNGTSFDNAMALGSATINTWHMVTVGWDKTAGEIWGYVDANFASDVAHTAYHTAAAPFHLGSWSASPQHYDGRIDEFAWWRDRGKLTQEEVNQLYNGGNGLPLENFDVPICWSYVAEYKNGKGKRYRQSGPGPFPRCLHVPGNVDKSTGRMVDDGILIDPDEYEVI